MTKDDLVDMIKRQSAPGMTAIEFKCWLAGLLEGMPPGLPTMDQWVSVIAQARAITAQPSQASPTVNGVSMFARNCSDQMAAGGSTGAFGPMPPDYRQAAASSRTNIHERSVASSTSQDGRA